MVDTRPKLAWPFEAGVSNLFSSSCASAQVQIEGDFLACSFSILEEQPMDMLLGLDMLKRHQVIQNFLSALAFCIFHGCYCIISLGCVRWKTKKHDPSDLERSLINDIIQGLKLRLSRYRICLCEISLNLKSCHLF